jgi:uncharacterized protein (DUF39 family)
MIAMNTGISNESVPVVTVASFVDQTQRLENEEIENVEIVFLATGAGLFWSKWALINFLKQHSRLGPDLI